MSSTAWRCAVGLVLLLALVARLSAVFWLKSWDYPLPGPSRQLAQSLLEYGALYYRDWSYFGPSSVLSPVYPTLLAGLFAIFGVENPTAYFAALATNAVLGAAAAATAIALLRRLTDRPGPALAAGALVAIWPPQVVAAACVQPIALTAWVVLLGCLMWHRLMQQGTTLSSLNFAIAAALAVLLMPAMLLAAVLALGALLIQPARSLDVRLRDVSLLLAAMALLVWPWVARNRVVHEKWLLTTAFWQQVWAGANPNATGSDRLPLTPERRAAATQFRPDDEPAGEAVRIPMMQVDLLDAARRSALRGQREVQREALFRQWTIEYVAQNPWRWLGQLPIRLLKTWFIDWDHPLSRHPLAMFPRAALSVVALAGAVALGWRGAPMVAACVAILAWAGLSAASVKQTIIMEPLQITLAVAGLAMLQGRRREQTIVAPARTGVES
ncbi:MAG: hypothetical protein NZ561_12010 [Phycisphaerae bacterium]|nr:hypothetical protein [Phycisphaerae bacterium]MDW8261815.1 hypothetical protein [Phycisphaerales bacterium]